MTQALVHVIKLTRKPVLEQIEWIHNGMKMAVIDEVAAALALPIKEVARALHINERTLRNRGKKGVLNREETEKGFRVVRVMAKAQEVLGSLEEASAWMRAPIDALGRKRPIDLLDTDLGVQEVDNLLEAIRWGVYV
ncbi:MAG TPA: antitoxin Xre/MbcA/ParS toxin-binding domain-containing protein [Candidatus Methylacidiphilales bacterium]